MNEREDCDKRSERLRDEKRILADEASAFRGDRSEWPRLIEKDIDIRRRIRQMDDGRVRPRRPGP